MASASTLSAGVLDQRSSTAPLGTLHLAFLPFDLLLAILAHLQVQDLLRLSQTSTQHRDLLSQYSVWYQAYSRTSLLVPPLDPSLSPDTECLRNALIRAAKLDLTWTSPNPVPVSRWVLPNDTSPGQHSAFDIFLERYLVVLASGRGVRCYDLDAEQRHIPIAALEDTSLTCRTSEFLFDTGTSSVQIAYTASSDHHSSIVILKLELPPKTAGFHTVAEIPGQMEFSPIFQRIRLRDRFVATYSNMINRPNFQMWDINTHQAYELSASTDFSSFTIQYLIFTREHLLVYCIFSDEKVIFQLVYELPLVRQSEQSGSTSPIRLHHISLQKLDYFFHEHTLCHYEGFPLAQSDGPSRRELGLLGFSPSGPRAVTLCLLEIFRQGEASMKLQRTDIASDSHAFLLNASSTRSSIRACSLSGRMGNELLLCSVRYHEGKQVISVRRIEHLFNSGLGTIDAVALDGFRGRVCVLFPDYIEVLEFV